MSWWRKQSLTGYPDLQSRLPLEEQGLQNQVGDSLVLGRCMVTCSALNEFIHDIVLILLTIFPCILTDPDSIQLQFPREEASIATSLWPLRSRPDGRGRVKLNKYQRKAIDLACSNTFVMIQGPPGKDNKSTRMRISVIGCFTMCVM